MEQILISHHNTNYTIKLIQKRHFKKLTLRINSKLNPQLSAPYGITKKQAHAFILNNIDWLTNTIKQQPNNSIIKQSLDNKSIVLFNEPYNIVTSVSTSSKNKVLITNNTIQINYTNSNNIQDLLIKAIKEISHNYLLQRIQYYCDKVGKSINKLILTDTKTKWGSCSNKGNIRINFRISMAPNFVIDYLVAHEVAHLVHFNHSTNFWQTVYNIYRDYTLAKQWLKNQGKTLF